MGLCRVGAAVTGRLVVLASGSGTNLGAILEAVADGGLDAEVSAVIVNRARAKARERALLAGVPVEFWPLSPYLGAAGGRKGVEGRAGVLSGSEAEASADAEDVLEGRGAADSGTPCAACRPEGTADGIETGAGWPCPPGRRRYDAALADAVASYRPDLVVLAGWMHLLSDAFLDRFPDQVVNLHPALPGQFPGADAIAAALKAHAENRITRTGVMVHYVPDHGIDSGPVIAALPVPIRVGDTIATLSARIHAAEHRLIVKAIAAALSARADARASLRPSRAADPRDGPGPCDAA